MLDMPKIERFTQMTQADPQNDLGFFSLGKAYVDGDEFRQAIPPLLKALQLNASLSPAYVLLAEAQRKVGDPESAVNTLQKGYRIAQEKGDLMPRNKMATMLQELGSAPPEEKPVEFTPELAAAGNIQCRRCGRVAPKMNERPFSGPLGEEIHQSVCNPCFQLWIRQGTKVINELRLNLTEASAQDIYDTHMKEFLCIK